MNYRGSYRHLLRNATAAVLAAIEIYNKPRFAYRDECFVILLLNAWELALKALLSKQAESIFYPKKRKEPYRTLSWRDALNKAERFFAKELDPLPVRRNLELLGTYRDNSVHFYNAPGFGSLIYALAQTSIVNLKDLMHSAFEVDLSEDITWQLLPLGLEPPLDPLEYISQQQGAQMKASAAVRQFIAELATATKESTKAGADTGRLLTVFSVKLESTKKIENADVIVGVQKAVDATGPLAVIRTLDPNVSHPLRQKEILRQIGTLHGKTMTSHILQAIAWKYQLKTQAQYCWQAKEGVLTKYSNDLLAFIKRLTEADLEAALKDYRENLRGRTRGRARQV